MFFWKLYVIIFNNLYFGKELIGIIRKTRLCTEGFAASLFIALAVLLILTSSFAIRYSDDLPLPVVTQDNMTRDIPVLMYHHLAPAETYQGTGNYANGAIVSIENFEAQMRYLYENGYQSIFTSELLEHFISGESLPDKTVCITFDDGYESNYFYALPILEKYGFCATINPVISTSISEQVISDSRGRNQYDLQSVRHFTIEQMEEMCAGGMIECHSHTFDLHGTVSVDRFGKTGNASTERAYLFELGRLETNEEYYQRVYTDLSTAYLFLRKHCPTDYTAIFYPYGISTPTIVSIAKQVGYAGGFTVSRRIANLDRDGIFSIPRVTVSGEDTMSDFIRKLSYAK